MPSRTIFEVVASLLFLWLAQTDGLAQTYRVAEMNTEQIRALEREKTVVLLPGGIIEQHGPYLPSFSDGYMNERLTQELADAIVARPGWKVLIFPLIPLGAGGANEIGGKYVFPGTYAVRASTLRAVFMDLATELGEQGFRWIFVVHVHGAPNHHRALEQAGDYFRETYGGPMVHLFGLVGSRQIREERRKFMSEREQQEEGFSVHADMNETSRILFLRPDLVDPNHKNAPPYTGVDMNDLIRIAKAEGWPGYFGSPRLASASFGALAWKVLSSRMVDVALKILDGLDCQQMERSSDAAKTATDKAGLQHEQEVERKQSEWLRKKGLE